MLGVCTLVTRSPAVSLSAELAEAFRTSLLALQKVADQLPLLSTKCQKAAQEEVQDLQVHL